MKIGILTQPLKSNYGGILQAYAMQEVLREMGHSPVTLQYKANLLKHLLIWPVLFSKHVIKLIMGRKSDFPGLIPNTKFPGYEGMIRFVNAHIATLSSNRFSKGLIRRNKIDLLLVGSDQTWRRRYNKRIRDMFLCFMGSAPIGRIAYAASFGTDVWEMSEKETRDCASAAKRFNAVSVREKSGVRMCGTYLGVDAVHVLDPTLLIAKEKYLSLIRGEPNFDGPFLFSYILDLTPDIEAAVRSIASLKGLKVVMLSAGASIKSTDCPERWISHFAHADFVVTDSFHGTAFAIKFQKEFLVLNNKARGSSRVESLLSTLQLNDRVLTGDSTGSPPPINWKKVNDILLREQIKSRQFLSQNIK